MPRIFRFAYFLAKKSVIAPTRALRLLNMLMAQGYPGDCQAQTACYIQISRRALKGSLATGLPNA